MTETLGFCVCCMGFFPSVCSIFLALFITTNVNRALDYQVYCAKVNAIIEKLAKLDAVNQNYGSCFFAVDNAKIFNLDKMHCSEWEIIHWLKTAHGNTQYTYNNDSLALFEEEKHKIESNGTYLGLKILGTIYINTKKTEMSFMDKLRLAFYNVLSKKHYDTFLESIGFIELSFEPGEFSNYINTKKTEISFILDKSALA